MIICWPSVVKERLATRWSQLTLSTTLRAFWTLPGFSEENRVRKLLCNEIENFEFPFHVWGFNSNNIQWRCVSSPLTFQMMPLPSVANVSVARILNAIVTWSRDPSRDWLPASRDSRLISGVSRLASLMRQWTNEFGLSCGRIEGAESQTMLLFVYASEQAADNGGKNQKIKFGKNYKYRNNIHESELGRYKNIPRRIQYSFGKPRSIRSIWKFIYII